MPVVSAISRLLGLTPAQLVGAIDQPGPRQPYARTLDVSGWALSTHGIQPTMAATTRFEALSKEPRSVFASTTLPPSLS